MSKKRLAKSVRKYVRKEKARIRREFWDLKEQEKFISEIYQKLHFNEQKTTNREQK